MHHFAYRNGRLHAEDVDLVALADEIGTPSYVYSTATLERHYDVFASAFADTRALIAFAVKANSNLAVIETLARRGAGADVVSEGEMRKALQAGVPAERIVFSGVGKTEAELAFGLKAGIKQFNVESAPELAALSRVAQSLNLRAPMAFRVNPDVAAGGHDKISTGRAADKFGVPYAQAEALYAQAAEAPWIDPIGVDMHIGSQIDALAPFDAAARKAADLVVRLRAQGHAIAVLDLGGGLGIPYHDGGATPPLPAAYAQTVRSVTDPLDVELVFEPGRMIAGNAGVLIARVIYVKPADAKTFLILDAGMNDLIRPALYDAYHEIWPVRAPDPDAAPVVYEVVGPVCETTDRFARDRRLPPLAAGDLVAFLSAGAYGAVQSNQYNVRPLAAEVLVRGSDAAVIRERPDFAAMTALEHRPDWLG